MGESFKDADREVRRKALLREAEAHLIVAEIADRETPHNLMMALRNDALVAGADDAALTRGEERIKGYLDPDSRAVFADRTQENLKAAALICCLMAAICEDEARSLSRRSKGSRI